jgi:hypothetical protein
MKANVALDYGLLELEAVLALLDVGCLRLTGPDRAAAARTSGGRIWSPRCAR